MWFFAWSEEKRLKSRFLWVGFDFLAKAEVTLMNIGDFKGGISAFFWP